MKLSELKKNIREEIKEAWNKDVKTDPKEKGKYKDWTVERLRNAVKNLKGKQPFTKEDKEKMTEYLFAIRAKTGWRKGKGATGT